MNIILFFTSQCVLIHREADEMIGEMYIDHNFPSNIYKWGHLIQKACGCLSYPYMRMTEAGTISP